MRPGKVLLVCIGATEGATTDVQRRVAAKAAGINLLVLALSTVLAKGGRFPGSSSCR